MASISRRTDDGGPSVTASGLATVVLAVPTGSAALGSGGGTAAMVGCMPRMISETSIRSD